MDNATKRQTHNAERLIDANALKARWYEINDIDETDRGARFVGYTEIARLIDRAPTIDTVKQGIWLKDIKNFGGTVVESWFCSVCGAVHGKPSTTDHYCYFCGAKMDGERSDE